MRACIFLVVLVAVLYYGGGFIWEFGSGLFNRYYASQESRLDPDTLCLVEEPMMVRESGERKPQKKIRRIAIVIDATDRIPDEQARKIGAWFNKIFPFFQGQKITLYELYENSEFRKPLFEKCAPSWKP